MRAHVIEAGKVVNTIEVAGINAIPGMQLISASAGGVIGDLYNAQTGTFTRPAAPAPAIPQEVSRRRGLRALFDLHRLKDTDMRAAIVQHITDPDQQYIALSEFDTSQTFEYDRPMVVFMCGAMGLDRAALFTYAAALD